MDDYKILIYILLAAASFLFTNWKKFFKGVDDPAQPKRFRDPNEGPIKRPQTNQNPGAPATSFDDILQELQPKVEQAKEQGREVYEKVREPLRKEPVIIVKSLEKPIAAPVSLEDPRQAKEFARKRQERTTLAAIPKQQAQVTRRTPTHADLLRSPGGIREAFILSEILNRKQF